MLVYKDEYIELYQDDCTEFIKSTDQEFDMVFADPPFNLKFDAKLLYTCLGRCKGHAFIMHSERELGKIIAFSNDNFSRMYAINTVVPNLISNKAPMQMADFVAEFRFSKTKFVNHRECFSNLIESKKLRMLKQYSGNFDKAEQLYATFIKHFTNEGDTIFDPFAGSLSLAKAARKLKRKVVCVEKSSKVINESLHRLTQQNLNLI